MDNTTSKPDGRTLTDSPNATPEQMAQAVEDWMRGGLFNPPLTFCRIVDHSRNV